MRERFARFMAGRNGNDQLNMFLLFVDLALMLISTVFARGFGRFLYAVVLLLLGLVYFRMFSRNLYKRRTENEQYLRRRMKLQADVRLLRERWKQRKEYKFFTCPSCKAVMRVPKGRGKIKGNAAPGNIDDFL